MTTDERPEDLTPAEAMATASRRYDERTRAAFDEWRALDQSIRVAYVTSLEAGRDESRIGFNLALDAARDIYNRKIDAIATECFGS